MLQQVPRCVPSYRHLPKCRLQSRCHLHYDSYREIGEGKLDKKRRYVRAEELPVKEWPNRPGDR